jgi:ketosteroid isomerase-like protein
MDDQQMKARIESLYAAGDFEALGRAQYEMAADDIVQEWPQSGERFRGRDTIAAVNANYPRNEGGGAPSGKLRRVLAPGDAWVIEGTIDYGDGIPVSMISILETSDGKVVRQTDYFASPFEAPEWRRKWAEQMEPVAAR